MNRELYFRCIHSRRILMFVKKSVYEFFQMTKNCMMVPENDGTINILLDHLQSLSDQTWPVKEEIESPFTTIITSHSSQVSPIQASSQLTEDWREVYILGF